MGLNVGINGFGRIGRIIFRTCLQNPNLKVSALNDPAVDIDYICYLIKFDSTHGKYNGSVERSDNKIIVDGQKISIFREKKPINIPWQIANVHYVFEASGLFTNLENASGHLASEGVKRVIVTAPSIDLPMVVLGVNDDTLNYGHKVLSCASSTLYCLAPIIDLLEKSYGVSDGFITSIHAMTPSLKPLDGLCLKGKHWRDHRSIHQNIIPASTGACRVLGKIIPKVKDKLTGLAFRVPIVNVSVLDLTVRLKTNTTIADIIQKVENASQSNMKNIIKVTKDQAVSSDFIGDSHSCILDTNSSLQLKPDFFKLICWYENEYSYACRAIDTIVFLETQYQKEWNTKLSYIPSCRRSLLQQSEKMLYHQVCSYDCNSSSKSLKLCATSHSTLKPYKQPPLTNKPLSCRNIDMKKQRTGKETKKKSELFKIWNDDKETVEAPIRHNTGSFFHSCLAIPPQIKENAEIKNQERLEEAKKKFSIMASMTENLLKKSHHSKIKIGLSLEPSTDEAGDAVFNNLQTREDLNLSLIKMKDNRYFALKGNLMSTKEVFENENSNKSVTAQTLKNTNEKKLNNEEDIFKDNTVTIPNDKTITCIKKTDNIPSNNSSDNNNTHSTRSITSNIVTICNQWQCINVASNSKTDSSCKELCSLSTPSSCGFPAAKLQTLNEIDFFDEHDVKDTKDYPQVKHGIQTDNLQKRLEGVLKKLSLDVNVISEEPSISPVSANTISSKNTKYKEDIFDKLDSISATDSENSFHMNERKSQVINITDLTNSLEDLERLDKICKIIEISDELSDQLLSTLNNNDRKDLKNKKWSFKDLCEKIKLDEFCNNMFSNTNA